MAEVGCLNDGCFQNLQVENAHLDKAAVEFTGTVVSKAPVKLLVNRGSAGVIKFAGADATVSVSDSGGIFLVPVLSAHQQTIALPAPSAATVGCKWTFIYVGDQDTAGALTGTFVIAPPSGKILATIRDTSHTYTAAMAQKVSVGFLAAAVPGAVITIVGLSATGTCGYIMMNEKESLINNSASISMA